MSFKSINISINKNVIIVVNLVVVAMIFIAGFIRHINLYVSGVLSGMALMFAIIEFSIAIMVSVYLNKHSKKSEDE